MKKQELAHLVREYGDAIITYRSEQSNKLKYNVCTLDFSTPYIQGKKNLTNVYTPKINTAIVYSF